MERRSARSQQGFTLFEVTLALLILLIMSAIALPELIDVRQNYLLRSVAADLVNDLQIARLNAITRDDNVRFEPVSTTAYRTQRQLPGGAWATELDKDLPRGFTLSSGGAVTFTPRGNSSQRQTFTLTNPHGRSRHVVVETSGRSYVQ